jgi:stress response protein YsnF
LAEESLAVGKRAVSGGTTRVRRYVVETPVEEQVALQDEKVVVDRRPVTGGQPVATFTDKIIEMTETHEEPVISKLRA